MLQGVVDEFVETGDRFHAIGRILEGIQRRGVLAPDLARPKHPRLRLLHNILQIIPDDVGLLKEQAHGVAKAQPIGPGKRGVLQTRRAE